MKLSKTQTGIIVIILFHVVGLAGFYLHSFRPLFLRIVPFHLELMLLVVLINHQKPDFKFVIFALMVYVLGFAGEWIGVHTQLLFGHYHYGRTLGPKLWAIPLTIGINWFLLVYGAGVLLQRSRLKNVWIRILVGTIILVALDWLIEPIAMRFDYWNWVGGSVPLKNYIGWFIVSAVFLGVFEAFKFKRQSAVAPTLLITQFIFFGLLHLV
ncbi:carotenoid biosynthesis protein [Mucilaginibacter robiniae]|uniref:Carotenoid biosynthesis protein n=1 Tax=Mucilaginibacter robiniae TaxID=2728022 RepID=A0A7L5E128_9SPHI|nr:carotenoid biosynthesis protein [Mucilaginibacter robiniae]QJD97080.1 carotenoid biosynthesis protein [Mucilaginibacter robiniae]